MSYHSTDALLDDDNAAVIDGGNATVAANGQVESAQMDISQAPEMLPGEMTLPTMAELDAMVAELDEVDATLTSLDSAEPVEAGAQA